MVNQVTVFIFVGGSTCNRGYMPQRVQSQSYYICGVSWCVLAMWKLDAVNCIRGLVFVGKCLAE
jgi:hypothetical protein